MVAEGGYCEWWGDRSGGEGLMGAKVGYRALRGWVWGEGQMVAEGGCEWWGDGSGGEGLMGAKVGYRALRGWVGVRVRW